MPEFVTLEAGFPEIFNFARGVKRKRSWIPDRALAFQLKPMAPLPPCGGARAPFWRAEGGKTEQQIQRLLLTPLPTPRVTPEGFALVPHKGGGESNAAATLRTLD